MAAFETVELIGETAGLQSLKYAYLLSDCLQKKYANPSSRAWKI